VKWPRYEIQVEPGLSYKEADRAAVNLLRAYGYTDVPLMLSQFKYDPVTGIVDTRVDAKRYFRL
jgi:hypothetical protein